jgi:hypothetical protein
MQTPKPSDAHQMLSRLVGRWQGEERLYPGPWETRGGKALARVENRSALDGFAVVQDYEQAREGTVRVRGHGVFSWDDPHQCYTMHWVDSMGLPPSEYKGSLNDNILTLTSANPQGQSRATFNLQQEGKYKFLMEVSPDGHQWFPMMEGIYSREKP